MLPKVHYGTYVSFLQNIGNVNCLFSYAHFGIQHYAIPREYKDYKGEIFLENTTGIVKITYFSPNEVKTKIQSLSDGFVVLNQNYFDGWKIKGKNITKAQSYNGLIAVPIPKGEHIITFYYLPDSFTIGGFLTLTSSILTICAIVKFRQ